MPVSDNILHSTEKQLYGRYITNGLIEPLIQKHQSIFTSHVIGRSVLSKPIYFLHGGVGPIKILMWSQMHGNEGTTTKAVFDMINYLSESGHDLLEHLTILIIPILNPDGAELYTRENANNIDLNRDFINLSQPESRLLNKICIKHQPDYCFNLHDQRTIYGVANTGKPATVSFLAPSFNESRDVNMNRSIAKEIIAVMTDSLQKVIPGQIGRFDDSFNANCVGDTFQLRGIPTILFEAGHFSGDYNREITRKYMLIALLSAINYISNEEIRGVRNADYLNIPQNKIVFYDFIYRNVKINYDNREIITNFASHYQEELREGEITFNSYITEIGNLEGFFGHTEYDAAFNLFSDESLNIPEIGQKADFKIGEIRFINGLPEEKYN